MRKDDLRGVLVALVTPFTSEGQLDIDGLRRLIQHLIDREVHGICPLCGTGEPLSLNAEERRTVASVVIDEVAGRVPVIVGAMGANQREVLDIAILAAERGADALLVSSPPFVMPTIAHTARQLKEIADASGLPLILFNAPTRVGVDLSPETIQGLREDIPTMIGVKEASGKLSAVQELIATMGSEVAILQGWDDQFYASLCVGASGGFLALANLIPELFVQILEAFQVGDLDTALNVQLSLLPLVRVIFSEPNPVPLKAAMDMVRLPAGPTRPPLYSPSAETVNQLRGILAELELIPMTDGR